jgi:hypothetical protein
MERVALRSKSGRRYGPEEIEGNNLLRVSVCVLVHLVVRLVRLRGSLWCGNLARVSI